MKTLKKLLLLLMVLTITLYGCKKDDNKPLNAEPIASASAVQQAEIGSVVQLDASGSTDPEGNELTYNWAFISKPDGSSTAIIGVGKEQAKFILDKAGTYKVLLRVSDGITEAMDSIMVTNKTPVLIDINTNIVADLDDEFAERGKRIYIYGNFFSMDINENKVTLDNVSCEIIDISTIGGNGEIIKDNAQINEQRIIIEVPDIATSGNLIVTVGTQEVTWPNPFRIISQPLEAYIENDKNLIEYIRDKTTYKDIGTKFSPLVNGDVLAFSARVPISSKVRITLWNVATKTHLTSEWKFLSSGSSNSYIKLNKPVSLEAGKEYLVTINSRYWYYYSINFNDPIYPKTIGNIEVINTMSGEGYDDQPTAFEFPESDSVDFYITRGAGIIFAPNIDQ